MKIAVFTVPLVCPGGLSYLGPQTGWHALCVDYYGIWVRGTPLAGTTSVLVTTQVMAAVTKQTIKDPVLIQMRYIFLYKLENLGRMDIVQFCSR